jgi:hypothetical protein
LVRISNRKRPPGRHRRRWKSNIEIDLQAVRWGSTVWIALAQDRADGGSLWMRWRNFGFHKIRGVSWLSEDLLVSQGALCTMELVS